MALDFPNENAVKTDNVHQINNNATFCFKAKTNQNAPRPWVCKICSFPFKFKGNLLEHMRFYHMKGNVPCNHCEKTFPSSKQLRKHMRDHSLARNQCPHCGSKLGTTTNAYDEHLKVCKRRPKNMLLSTEVSQPVVSSDANKYTIVALDSELPKKRQKLNTTCNIVPNKQCALCLLKFADENAFQHHQCLPTASSECGIVISDTQEQQKFDNGSNDILNKHCAICQLEFVDENAFQQHKCLPMTTSSICNVVMSCANNSTSPIVQAYSNLTSFTPSHQTTQSIPNLLPRADIYNQQQFIKNKCSFPTYESFGVNVNLNTYSTGPAMTSYPQIGTQHQILPNYYKNTFHPIPSTLNAYMPSYTARFSTPSHLYSDFTKAHSFNSLTNNTRSPLQCLSHITAALENQQSCNSVPKSQTCQLSFTNSSNGHCVECMYPLPLTQLNTRDFVAHVCPYCSVMFKKIECLDNHISMIHMVELYKNPSFITTHTNSHNSWFCSSCRKYFSDHQTFITHKQYCFVNEPNIMTNTWYCDKCNNTFNTKLHLLQHDVLCQISNQQQHPICNEKAASVPKRNETIEPHIEHREIFKTQNEHDNVNQYSNLASYNSLDSIQSNTNCMKCRKISVVCGREKVCVPCFLKVKLNEDFKLIKKYKISLHFSSHSIIYKAIDSHIFHFNRNYSTELKCYFCENCFNDISLFQAHFKTCNKFKKNPMSDFIIVCCHCSMAFTALISFQAHTFNCKNTQNSLLKTKASNNITVESQENSELSKSLQTETKVTEQSVKKTEIWECELCRKTFSNFLVFAIHLSGCKSSTQYNKPSRNSEVSKQISEKSNIHALINTSESNLVLQEHDLLYCSQCGHRFKDESEFQLHPCDEILKYMTTCFVQLECLKFNKTIMRRLLSIYGYPNGWQMKKKQCLSYRERYNEVFQNPEECNLILKKRPKTNCQAVLNHYVKGAIEENTNEHDKLLAKLVCDSERKFCQRGAHFPAEIYSQKFICSCGQVRPYLQASVHMKIHRNSKNHQIKFLKPLAVSAHGKYQKLSHISCRNCKQDFHNVELFIGHTIFLCTCRKFYKAIAKRCKFTKTSKTGNIFHNHDMSSIKQNQTKKCVIDHEKYLADKSFSSLAQFELTSIDVNNDKNSPILKIDNSVNTYAIEFADKVANFIKSEMSSSSITKQQQSMSKDHSSFSDHLQQLEDSKNKLLKRFSSSDGFMIEIYCRLGESMNNIVSKYICASCYKSLYSKAALLDHLKQEHGIQGIIKLSVIKNQTSSVHTVQTISSVKSSVIKEQDFPLNNDSVNYIPWSPVITNAFSLGPNTDMWKK